MPLSDSSGAYTRVLRPEPSPADLLLLLAGASEVSRFSCMKLPDVSGIFDYAGLTRDSRYRPCHVAFHQVKSVGALIASFRSSIPSPPVPLFTLRRAPRSAQRKTRGRVVRYSFLVGLFHSLLHAGLSRRTDLAIWRLSSSGKSVVRDGDYTSRWIAEHVEEWFGLEALTNIPGIRCPGDFFHLAHPSPDYRAIPVFTVITAGRQYR